MLKARLRELMQKERKADRLVSGGIVVDKDRCRVFARRRRFRAAEFQEGELSALASKILRIQEKIENETHQAQREKEQVKSLISNLSHQLKTPLANVCMYCELSAEEEDPGRQKVFQKKIKKQLEEIDWILGSLFKMVKLEQGAVSLRAERSSRNAEPVPDTEDAVFLWDCGVAPWHWYPAYREQHAASGSGAAP